MAVIIDRDKVFPDGGTNIQSGLRLHQLIENFTSKDHSQIRLHKYLNNRNSDEINDRMF
jgi:hypothetical protein